MSHCSFCNSPSAYVSQPPSTPSVVSQLMLLDFARQLTGAIERHLPETLPIQRAHMQTLQLPTLTSTDSTLTYLYRLRPGFAGTSHACHCARLCGVPESVVERADRICRIGLRAWHDSEARRNEAVVRRLIQLDLGNEEEEERDQRRPEMDDDTARKMIRWVLEGDFDEEERTARVMSQIETERAAA